MDRPDLLQFDVAYPARLKRWLIFFRGLFVIPHSIVLWFLSFAITSTRRFVLPLSRIEGQDLLQNVH